MIRGVRVTFWMSIKHLFGVHSEYVDEVKSGNTWHWNGGFICAVCGKKSQPIAPRYDQKSFEELKP